MIVKASGALWQDCRFKQWRQVAPFSLRLWIWIAQFPGPMHHSGKVFHKHEVMHNELDFPIRKVKTAVKSR
jgi:hypothetical protein